MVKVQKGDVIRLHYTGKVKETGEIFDTTYEEIAKKAGIYNEKGIYGPVPIAVGAGHVLKGLDEQLEGLEVGKKYEIIIPPEKGFGKRDPKLIKTFTLGQFRRQGIFPFPGMPVEIETESGRKLKGKVLTVSGGRVRVDFNHPYAGKHLVYEVEVVEKIEDPIEKVKALIELRMPMVKPEEVIIEVGEKDVSVDFSNVEIDRNTLVLGEILLESDLKFIGYEEVKFKPSVDELLKPPEKEEQTTELEEEVSEPLIEKAEEDKPAEETTETEGVKAEESEEKKEETPKAEEVKEEPETRKEEQAEEKPKKKSTKKSKTTRKRSTSAKKRKTTKKKTEKPAESAEEKKEETE
ncbi:peptidylprolyl isomerase [Thermococcus sp. GR7]|uniref:FKBP-type peptidyl-prolyl cis-trans isomerase n=1 Tax=unclassified Thermococcus TaxID=2627626 RepID=UPI001430E209|nr:MULTISPECIES: peptidylprolyl isomerase [unclassified Thermococcus]NJE46585.1 peptidylprolyl isomerase [Thermococcus sp. GR7]NJE79062.1 peptidylprolyl isomerase [Thermococcus sp. GR4]NJF23584.1 peptidylprolyl isomerase [Thermococcus sp. GR5]